MDTKIKCNIKITNNLKEDKNKKRKILNIFDDIYKNEEADEKKTEKIQKIRSIKNGQMLIDSVKEKLNDSTDILSLNFIKNLEKKLNRINNKKKIIYLNYPKNDSYSDSSNESSSKENISDVEISDITNLIIKNDNDCNNYTKNKSESLNNELKIISKDDIIQLNKDNLNKEIIKVNDECGDKKNSIHDNYSNILNCTNKENDDENNIISNDKNMIHDYNITEQNLTFKRKTLLDKFNKNEKEMILKNELNLYQDFKEHNIQIENYGKHILSKMGYNEDIYNKYINKYYNEYSDNNYFDKIYEYFQSREFRFTGIGAEEEMKENMEIIKKEKYDNKNEGVEDKKKIKDIEKKNLFTNNFKDCKNNDLEETDESNRDVANNNNNNKCELKSNIIEKTKKDKIEEKKSGKNNNFFEGLIVKINLKTHEFYKRKGIIIYKKEKKDINKCYYGLLLFKNYKYIIPYKKIIKEKIKEFQNEKQDNYNYFWEIILKDLKKKIELNKDYINNKERKEKNKEFEICEVNSKYLETIINNDCLKCKIVNKNLSHPIKKTSLYKETVELKKIKMNYAYIQFRKKYILKVSLDDICQYINHI
ncbi:conserved Plasmodium protein, unknown function [Plasmodium gallinaceum]|uniref:Uncharacterized protein n=1 Tax=Plasmodium gallinaceum TaxID=5849 RepID=A0A1J1GWH1_PLAGA|nr:conserved Plasmodium protein, unknown function [Plasmodium gallinaceum]CRG96788.1 conserved Plasmodium protein, unknown function [Plasmodium gallinaceum]